MTGPPGDGARWPASTRAAAQVFVEDLGLPALTADDGHHLVRVLRLRSGAVVVAADGRGRWRRCVLDAAGPALVPDGPVIECPPPGPPVTVAFVPVKGDRPEWVVQKLTEVGVDRIVVLRSARSVVRWDRDGAQQSRALDRLRRVAVAAAAQSRRPHLPVIDGVWELDALVRSVAPAAVGMAEPGGAPPSLGVPVLAVGPEGGWSDEELADPAVPRVGLGPTVLRAETAAVVAGAILCALRGGIVAPGSEQAPGRPGGAEIVRP